MKKQPWISYANIVATILLVFGNAQICQSQKRLELSPLNDSIMRREMAFFTIADTLKAVTDVKLKEISLYYSDGHSANFHTRSWFDDGRYLTFEFDKFDTQNHEIKFNGQQDSIIVAIDGLPCWGVGNRPPRRKLNNIRLIIHAHLEVEIPKNAFEGIFEPPNYQCQTKKDSKKEQHFFKYYLSADNLRMYIYMVGGQGKNRYEVTWVFYASKYLGRFINHVHQ
jgi:hypothetical protein